MAKRPARLVLVLMAVLVGGCSGDDEQDGAAKPGGETIFQEQIDALEKAKQVEQLLQNSNEQQRRLLEEQGN